MPERESSPTKHRKHPKSPRRSSRNNESSPSSRGQRTCSCGREMACAGMSHAFRLLGDPRCHFVELPHFKPDPPAYKYVFRNNLRAAYVKNLAKHSADIDMTKFEDIKKRRFVALHHFHPAVVKAFYENPLTSAQKHKVPISITEHEMRELDIELCDEDRILSVRGTPTGGYFFVPSYPPENVHEDLKVLVRTERQRREAEAEELKSKEEEKLAEAEAEAEAQQFTVADRHIVPTDIKYSATASDAQPAPTAEADDDTSTEDVEFSKKEEGDLGDVDAIVDNPTEAQFDDLWEKSHRSEEDPIHPTESATSETIPTNEINQDAADAPDERSAENKDEHLDESKRSSHASIPDKAEPLEEDEPDEDSLALEDASSQKDVAKVKDIEDDLSESSGREVEKLESIEVDLSEQREGPTEPLASDDDEAKKEDTDANKEAKEEAPSNDSDEEESQSSSPRKLAARNSDHPWDLSKYRAVEPETQTKRTSALFIDPKLQAVTTPDEDEEEQSPEKAVDNSKDGKNLSPRMLPSRMGVIQEGARESSSKSEVPDFCTHHASSGALDPLSQDPYEHSNSQEHMNFDDEDEDEGKKSRNKYHSSFSIQRTGSHDSGEGKSVASVDSGVSTSAIALNHEPPGSDPTLRIQVHNDLIALESKRRSEMKVLLDTHREQWSAARAILRTGVENVEFSERLVSGFGKAGMLFADALTATADDRLLDDKGNMVTSSFGQNRLRNRRSAHEYSIGGDKRESGQSTLLMSIIQSQLATANSFDTNARQCLEDILPEMTELKVETQNGAREIESLGDSIVEQLVRSEAEVKNLWDVFDALVTGDLMEYSVHGSHHGSMHGSLHGGSIGGSIHSMQSTNSGNLHGNYGFEISSNVSMGSSPMKSAFRQLGTVEDGWLIELLYKSAVTCQRKVFGFAMKELEKLHSDIIIFEDKRLKNLHQLLMAFVPRQRRLINALPEHLTGALDNLVGMRIDEESLQALIDEMIRDRSSDRLKKSQAHRSSIMNRSRVIATTEAAEVEVADIEDMHGNPFDSSLILGSKVLELKRTGLGSIVNASWKVALVVVTRAGNIHVFELPAGKEPSSSDQSPSDAARSLYPSMNFESQPDWMRKIEIKKRLSPFVSLNIRKCKMTISNLRTREVEIVEEENQSRSSGFFGKNILKAVKDGGQRQTRCTLRLPTPLDATEWAGGLQKTKSKFKKKRRVFS